MNAPKDPLDRLAQQLNTDRATLMGILKKELRGSVESSARRVAEQAGREAAIKETEKLATLDRRIGITVSFLAAIIVVIGILGITPALREVVMKTIYPPTLIQDNLDGRKLAEETTKEKAFSDATVHLMQNPENFTAAVKHPVFKKTLFEFDDEERYNIAIRAFPRIASEFETLRDLSDQLKKEQEARWSNLGTAVTNDRVLEQLIRAVERRSDELLALIEDGEINDNQIVEGVMETLGRRTLECRIETVTPVGNSIWEIPFDSNLRQAVLVIGKDHPKHDYLNKHILRYSVAEPRYPNLYFRISRNHVVNGNKKNSTCELIRLIGMESETGNRMTLRVTQRVAEELKLPGANQPLKGTGKGLVSLDLVSWNINEGH